MNTRSQLNVRSISWKYAGNLQENTHAKVRLQYSCKATLLKSCFGMGISYKFAAYFQNTFSQEYLWMAASGYEQLVCLLSAINFLLSRDQLRTYSETSKMEFFVKIVNSFQPLTIFAKSSFLYIWLGSQYGPTLKSETIAKPFLLLL